MNLPVGRVLLRGPTVALGREETQPLQIKAGLVRYASAPGVMGKYFFLAERRGIAPCILSETVNGVSDNCGVVSPEENWTHTHTK